MSKRAAIAKATGVASHIDASAYRLLQAESVVLLSRNFTEALSSVSSARKARPSRSACSLLALQVLVVAAGLRRAALVDALDLSPAQASAISSRLTAISKQERASGTGDLQYVRLLHHAATGQTFIVSRQHSLWADMSTFDSTSGQRLWIDARSTAEHAAPTQTSPDPHVRRLLERVYQVSLKDACDDVLVVSQAVSDPTCAQSDDHSDTCLVGVALAGFLLEYGAVYCLHNVTATDGAAVRDYRVQPLRLIEMPLPEPDFASSTTNCLGSQPLFLFKFMWNDSLGTSYELLSFSIPQCLITHDESEQARRTLIDVFQTRVDNIAEGSTFAHGRISAQVSTVTLSRVSL